MEIAQKLIGDKFPTLISSQEEALVRISRLQAKDEDLPVQNHLSLGSSYELYEKSDLPILSGKMLKVSCLAEADGTLGTSLLLFPKVGILSGGKFSTPKISVSLKTESVSLSAVLETKIPQKYFLSDKLVKSLMKANGTFQAMKP